jgi:serine/threonine protein kinase
MATQATGFPAPFGRYTLLRKLARGGMAELFLATGPGMRSPVVVKRVLPHFTTDPEFLSMFLNEARVAAQLAHPGIVRVFDLGQEGGQLYLTMEYIDGFDLETIARAAGGSIPPELAAFIGASICDALYYANTMTDLNGRPLLVIHRDVTPGNVMITRSGVVKLVDFGIAKATAQLERTKPGVVKGKFRYMSPEQIEQKELDGRSDLFSLGVLLYEVTTGRKPFDRPQIIDIIRALTSWTPPPPAQAFSDYPPLVAVVSGGARPPPRDRRFANAREMQRALETAYPRGLVGPANLAGYLRELIRAVPEKLGVDPAEEARREAAARAEADAVVPTAPMSRAEVRRMVEAADRRAARGPRQSPPSGLPRRATASQAPLPGLFDEEEKTCQLSPGDTLGDEEMTTTNPSPVPSAMPWDLDDDDSDGATQIEVRPGPPRRQFQRARRRPPEQVFGLDDSRTQSVTGQHPREPTGATDVSRRRRSRRPLLLVFLLLLVAIGAVGGWLLSARLGLDPAPQRLGAEPPIIELPAAEAEPEIELEPPVRPRRR